MAGYASAARKKPGVTYETVVREVRAGNIKPVYFLMGEESYYIDHVADFIVDSVLRPEERDFNLITFYGPESSVDNVLTAAKAYPMGAQRMVVLVKEAQALKGIDRLALYLRQPQETTVLVFCHKHGSLDRRLKVTSLIEKAGVLFESPKLRDYQLPAFVNGYLKRKRVAAEQGVAEMMGEYVGADLCRMAGELDKLVLALPEGEKTVTVAMVNSHIARTRNFNVFELRDALGEKNVILANQIVKYFDKNPKANPVQMVLPSLFNYFSSVMLAYYSPDRSERGLAAWLGMSEWQVRRNVLPPMRNYKGGKVMQILSEIRRADARSKGGGGSSATSPGDLMKELVFFILH